MASESIKCSNLSKWDAQTTMKFLQLYHQHECLWNRWCKFYKDKQMRTLALSDIRDKMNLPNFDTHLICSKIRILRTTYTEERKKMQRRYDIGGQYTTQLEWFSFADSFLRNVVQYRRLVPINKTTPSTRSKKSILEKYNDNRRQKLNDLNKTVIENHQTNNTKCNQQDISISENKITKSPHQKEDSICSNEDADSTIEVKSELCNNDWTPSDYCQTNTTTEEDNRSPNNASFSGIELNCMRTTNNVTSCNEYATNLAIKDSTTSSSLGGNNYYPYNSNDSIYLPAQAYLNREHHNNIVASSLRNNNNYNNNNSSGGRDSNENVSNYNNHNSSNIDEEFNIFGTSIASQLKRLPLDKAYELELKIQYLLTNAKLEAMGRDPSKIFDKM